MSISRTSIAAGATFLRGLSRQTSIRIVPVTPGNSFNETIDGELVQNDNLPVAAGQLRIHQVAGTGQGKIFQLYCAVDLSEDTVDIDAGNFATETSAAQNSLVYDGGDFASGASGGANSEVIDGGLITEDDQLGSLLVWKIVKLQSNAVDRYTKKPIPQYSDQL